MLPRWKSSETCQMVFSHTASQDGKDVISPRYKNGLEGSSRETVRGEPSRWKAFSVYEKSNAATSPDSSKKEKWRIVVRVVAVNKTYSGVNVHQTVSGFQMNSFELYAGDRVAEKADE